MDIGCRRQATDSSGFSPKPEARSPKSAFVSEQGLTLFEVTLMLFVTVALVGGLAPTMSAVARHAELVAANTDMQNIRTAILAFLSDTGRTNFDENGDVAAGAAIELLVSDGDIPEAGLSANWLTTTATSDKDFLEEHLVSNSFNGGSFYSTTDASPWRGAYLNAPINPDPWGNRYAVNTQYLGASTNDVVVFSAGPDEKVDTSDTGNPLVAVGDDLIVLVEA